MAVIAQDFFPKAHQRQLVQPLYGRRMLENRYLIYKHQLAYVARIDKHQVILSHLQIVRA